MTIKMTPYMMESLDAVGVGRDDAMAAILQLSQGLGLSRMSLTFLMGSEFSGDRSVATVLGFVLYIIGGWLFASSPFVLYHRRPLYVVGRSILGLITAYFCSFASFLSCRSSIPEWRRNTMASQISASLSHLAFWR